METILQFPHSFLFSYCLILNRLVETKKWGDWINRIRWIRKEDKKCFVICDIMREKVMKSL